jgi:hypothetical protein
VPQNGHPTTNLAVLRGQRDLRNIFRCANSPQINKFRNVAKLSHRWLTD